MRRRTVTYDTFSSDFDRAVQLHDTISMSVKRQKSLFPRHIFRILLAALGLLAGVQTFQAFYQFPIIQKPVLIAGLFFCGLFGIIYQLPRRFRWCVVLLLLGFEAVVYRRWDACLAGYRTFYRFLVARVHHKDIISDELTCTEFWTEAQCATFFACCCIFIIAMLLTYFVVAHPNFFISFVLTFPFLESGLLFGYQLSPIPVFALVCFWVAVLALQCTEGKMHGHSEKVNAHEARSMFLARAGMRFSASEVTAACMLLLTFCVSFGVVRSTATYERSEKIDKQRSEFYDMFRNFSFKDITGKLSMLPLPFQMNLLMDEIDLTDKGNVEFSGSAVLRIEMDTFAAFANQDYSVYLRGICRSEYTGSGWDVSHKELKAQKELFGKLNDMGALPQTIAYHGNTPADKCVPIKIHALQSEQVNYVPYQALWNSDDCTPVKKYLYDSELRLNNTQDYQMDFYPNAEVLYSSFPQDLMSFQATVLSKFSNLPIGFRNQRSNDDVRQQYEDFACDFYTRLDNVPPELLSRQESLQSLASGYTTYGEILSFIKATLWASADYTLSPGNTPEGADFVSYFLNTSHRGYCAHYASAAVLLCRMAGIPARYVQGYVINRTDLLRGIQKEGGKIIVNLPDSRAHAWAEIFVPTIGWIPYEFTEDVQNLWSSGALDAGVHTVTSIVPVTTTTTTTTTHTTQAASATSAASRTRSTTTAQNGGGSDGHKLHITRAQIIVFASILLFIGLLAAALAIWRKHHENVVKQRTQLFRESAKNPNRTANAGYRFVIQLLKMQGITQGKRTHEGFAAYAQEQCSLLPEGAMDKVIAVQQEVVFSGGMVSEENASAVAEIAQQLAKSIFDAAPPRKQFRLRWIEHIVQ